MKTKLHCHLWNRFDTSVQIIPFYAFQYEISIKKDLYLIFLTLVKVNDLNPLKRMNWFLIPFASQISSKIWLEFTSILKV